MSTFLSPSRQVTQLSSKTTGRRVLHQLGIATNWPCLAAVAVLVTMGLLSIWADSRHDPLRQNDPYRQLTFLAVGVTCMFGFQVINYQKIGRLAWAFYLGSLLLLLYTVMPGVPRTGFGSVPVRNGAHAWIDFKVMAFQPAEVTKIAFVMVLARYLRFRSNYRTIAGLVPPFLLALTPLALILKQPDLGTALVFIPVLFAMLFVAGAKVGHLLAIVGMGVAVAPLMWFSGSESVPVMRHLPELVKPYQRARVYAMFSDDPSTLQGIGYQGQHAAIAMGSGGITGKGPGNVPVGRKVPEAHNDMVFCLVGEQFGFVGSLIVIGAYVVLFFAGVEISAATREPFGRLVALGTIAVLAGQTFINLAVVTRLMPVTGITLPFVSAGGSSLIASFMAVGLLLNIGQNRPIVMARESFEY
jgi:rod shape determining protein RodA